MLQKIKHLCHYANFFAGYLEWKVNNMVFLFLEEFKLREKLYMCVCLHILSKLLSSVSKIGVVSKIIEAPKNSMRDDY